MDHDTVHLEDYSRITPILAAREVTHGTFNNSSRTAQAIKHVMRESVNWCDLSSAQKEALDQIATKIGRILSGDPDHRDAWFDIQGYARLVEERL